MLGVQKFNQPSVMAHNFSSIPHADIPRSRFKRSFSHKTTFDAGYLIPIYVDEALPGDTFSLNLSAVARLNTPLTPFMDNLYMDFHFFAVPNRLLWDNWQKFMGEQDNPDDSTDFLIPQVAPGSYGWEPLSLADYFGIPTEVADDSFTVSALPFRAYNLIYKEWYRDQNLIDSPPINKGDGPDDVADYSLRRRCKRHDYFTSCLPWPQKGPGVELPLGSTAPVITGADTDVVNTTGLRARLATTGAYPAAEFGIMGAALTGNIGTTADPGNFGTSIQPSNLWADLSNATAATINSLREAFQLQKLMERDARGGTRYVELIRSHFGVTSPDFRLQRPEYLGGGTRPVIVDPIANTTPVSGAPQGNLAAVGYCNTHGIGFTKSFVEHSTVIGIVSVRADLTYQHGLNRMWSRSTKWDYYWPALAHLGEQAVLSKEIFVDGSAGDSTVFGYQERWSEYKYLPSLITGQMRSINSLSLDSWHLSQDFGATRPELNQSFIEENPPIDRVVAVPTQPDFKFDSFFDLVTTRPMPMYSVPGLIDHF